MTKLTLEAFQQGPMTGSTPEALANAYGFGTVQALLDDIPQGAFVADVGSGLSSFGRRIAEERPDVHVFCADIQYGRRNLPQQPQLDELLFDAPPNIRFLPADVMALPDTIDRMHRIYSYNMATHMYRISHALGERAVRSMVSRLRPGEGKLYVGPTNGHMLTKERWNGTVARADAPEQELQKVDKELASPWWATRYYEAAASSGVAVYQANRFQSGTGERARGKVISDNSGETCYPLKSRQGLRLAARFAIHYIFG